MPESDSSISRFFEKVKTMGLIERLVSWGEFRSLSYNAYGEYRGLQSELDTLRKVSAEYSAKQEMYRKTEGELAQSSSLKGEVSRLTEALSGREKRLTELSKDVEVLREKESEAQREKMDYEARLAKAKEGEVKDFNHINNINKDLAVANAKIGEMQEENVKHESEIGKLRESDVKNNKRIAELQAEVEGLKSRNSEIQEKLMTAEKSVTEFEGSEEQRLTMYKRDVEQLNALREQLESDRLRTQAEREEEIKRGFEEMKLTWAIHEEKVEESLRNICSLTHVEYVDKEQVHFRTKPDNAIKICGELVVFDAKSPETDDLRNFPKYIRDQADAVKKYVKEDGVRREVFLVVPSNTIQVLDTLHYNMAEYDVFVVTVDSLMPLVKNLKKIEDYEFAEQLSPEDRDNICRVIGKLVHAAKRRIQVDAYFCNDMMATLASCGNLPDDVQAKVLDYEKSDKMNPPQEKRSKVISETEIKRCEKTMEHAAADVAEECVNDVLTYVQNK